MKKIRLSGLFLALVMVMSTMTFQSCGKYEEGPAFSLRSKKSRLVNKWKVEKMYENGKEITLTTEEQAILNATTYEFTSDNKFIIHSEITQEQYGETYTTVSDITYDWDFNSDKTKILLTNGRYKTTVTYGGQTQTIDEPLEDSTDEMTILKLKNDELKLKSKEDSEGNTSSIEFVPAE